MYSTSARTGCDWSMCNTVFHLCIVIGWKLPTPHSVSDKGKPFSFLPESCLHYTARKQLFQDTGQTFLLGHHDYPSPERRPIYRPAHGRSKDTNQQLSESVLMAEMWCIVDARIWFQFPDNRNRGGISLPRWQEMRQAMRTDAWTMGQRMFMYISQ